MGRGAVFRVLCSLFSRSLSRRQVNRVVPDGFGVAYITGFDSTFPSVWLTPFLSLCNRKTNVMGMNKLYAVYFHVAGEDAERGIRGRDSACSGEPLFPVLPRFRVVPRLGHRENCSYSC